MTPATSTPSASAILAFRFRRLWAAFIDLALVSLVVLIANALTADGNWSFVLNVGVPSTDTLAVIALYLFVYAPLTMARDKANGQTFGKQWTGLRVVQADRKPLGYWSALGREAVKVLPVSPTFGVWMAANLGFLVMGETGRALHDRATKTVVIAEDYRGAAPLHRGGDDTALDSAHFVSYPHVPR